MSPEEQEAELSGMVRRGIGAVLGYKSEEDIDRRPFRDLGFDSLTAVEFRNELARRAVCRSPRRSCSTIRRRPRSCGTCSTSWAAAEPMSPSP
ncbi:acyl carrier protein [Streptomyces zhihengii]